MQYLLTKAGLPLLLVVCLFCAFEQTEQDSADPSAAPTPSMTMTATDSNDGLVATKYEERPRQTFGEYSCITDCAEYLTGYQWAEENGVSEPDNCDGRSAEFMEGCRVYAEERTASITTTN